MLISVRNLANLNIFSYNKETRHCFVVIQIWITMVERSFCMVDGKYELFVFSKIKYSTN